MLLETLIYVDFDLIEETRCSIGDSTNPSLNILVAHCQLQLITLTDLTTISEV